MTLDSHERRPRDEATDPGVPQSAEPATEDGDCLCGYEGPDRYGNYDLVIENPACPLHGFGDEGADCGYMGSWEHNSGHGAHWGRS